MTKKKIIIIICIILLVFLVWCHKNDYIKKSDEHKKQFMLEQNKKIEMRDWVIEAKEKELKELYQKQKEDKECIKKVKKTLWKKYYYNCNDILSFGIKKASADFVETPKKWSFEKDWWRKNSQWRSKSKAELCQWECTFETILKRHNLKSYYWQELEDKWKVKKEVALCIARRDSWLWKY